MQFKKYNLITAIKDITPSTLWGSLALLLLGLLMTVLITLIGLTQDGKIDV